MSNIKFNKYIYENKDTLFNLTTKKCLSKKATIDEFKNNFFLENQEAQSLENALFDENKNDYISIKVVPTWECNLRCSHCFVAHELVKKDLGEINIKQFIKFIEKYVSKYKNIKLCSVIFLGGEPTLRAKFNNRLIRSVRKICEKLKINCKFSATTNGIELDENIIKFYNNLDRFTISLDGLKTNHDNQRKAIDKNKISPFDETLKTIKVLAKLGISEKMHIQASLDDSAYNENDILDFYRLLLRAGVIYKNIIIGCIVPTEKNPKITSKLKEVFAKDVVFQRACCKYRFMRDFVIDSSNNIYCDYFYKKDNILGKITDPLEKIAENHKNLIKEKMPALNDPKCKECPVIGACWGFCCNLVTINPSDFCNQKGLIEKIQKHSSEGNLKDLFS